MMFHTISQKFAKIIEIIHDTSLGVNFMLDNIKKKWNLYKKLKAFKTYPKSMDEILDDEIKYKQETIQAILDFKAKNPWKGSQEEIQAKFHWLNETLSKIYKIEKPTLVFLKNFAYGSCYFYVGNMIVIIPTSTGKLSVLVYLHEFGHALGMGEPGTCKWSTNLFKRYFPEKFEKLTPKGHLLYTETGLKEYEKGNA